MLLRIRVTLPDRPGALGQVARTMGVTGADIVQVVVLERHEGRVVDDFTVNWPDGVRVESLLSDLTSLGGVRVDGLWSATGAPFSGGHDAQLLAQLARNPADGLATLVDAVPGILAVDWAAAVAVPSDWAERVPGDAPRLLQASWHAAHAPTLPRVTPLRPRAMAGPDGVRYAAVPFERAGAVLIAAREHGTYLAPAPFHGTEVERLTQLVHAAATVLGERLDEAALAVPESV